MKWKVIFEEFENWKKALLFYAFILLHITIYILGFIKLYELIFR